MRESPFLTGRHLIAQPSPGRQVSATGRAQREGVTTLPFDSDRDPFEYADDSPSTSWERESTPPEVVADEDRDELLDEDDELYGYDESSR